jgi:hypothetical protein
MNPPLHKVQMFKPGSLLIHLGFSTIRVQDNSEDHHELFAAELQKMCRAPNLKNDNLS